ncbi:synembryn [Drosophila ficusphila]|uniref:synembryn n=1 Tax=Drosophila ficusphila TaxID=30025 RepID=UPI0007E745D9|nr:synembryn [Drosophila ficusphila]
MEAEHLKRLEAKEADQIPAILTEFNTKYADLMTFDSFRTDNQWHELWLAIFGILDDQRLSHLHPQCLNAVRILTRDEFSLETNYIEHEVNTLLRLARIEAGSLKLPATPDELRQQERCEEPQLEPSQAQSEVIAEALKCLCNLVYQNSDCRRQCLHQHCLDAILKRVASSMRHPSALEYYDMKLLFLLTALEPAARSRLQIDLNGLTYMTKWLDDKLGEETFDDEQLNIICELLKVMFNVTSAPDKSPNEYEIQSLHLTGVLRELLLRFGDMATEKKRAVVTHAINLLTNISDSCLIELTLRCSNAEVESLKERERDKDNEKEKDKEAGARAKPRKCCSLCFEKRNVSSLDVVLRYLRQSLLQQKETEATSHELLSPVLTVLVKCARSDRVMRHYLRQEVLPPLRDVSQRPEVGDELRNHLCRFLTLPAMILRDLAAELLFVLCKENVGRMIKYTGYGNAAGLFAKRGILDCRRVEGTDYSSDSEDSDTEEYKQQQPGINPVIGSLEPNLEPHPLEGMSEEQKEYEAMKLVNLIEQLHQGGIVKPALIDKDGRPQPLEHILQLQEELPQQQLDQKRKT